LRVTWGGHATVLVELDGARFLTDPVFRGRVVHLRRQVGPPAAELSRRVDALLVSHAHFDHLDLPSLRRFDRDTPVLVPPGAGRLLGRAGFREVTELGPGEEVAIAGVGIRAVEAEHDGRRHPWSRSGHTVGFVLGGNRRVYFAGDTDLFPGMEDLIGQVDLALLPIWGWGHRLGPGHMDPRAAARAAAMLRPGLTVPVHWGTYFPFGLKSVRGRLLESPVRAFEQQMAELAPELDARILRPGESLRVPPGPGRAASS